MRTAILSLLLLVAVTFGLVGHSFQMESVFGRAAPAEHGGPFWLLSPPPPVQATNRAVPELRAVTYNLHTGLGSRWSIYASRASVKDTLRAIARRIVEAAPVTSPMDVVALNEVDFGSRRSGWLNQAVFLAAELEKLTGMPYRVVQAETWRRDVPGLEVRFGNALLVRHPVLTRGDCLLGVTCGNEIAGFTATAAGFARVLGERRGVIQARVDFHGRPVDVLVTHLESMVLAQREAQAAEILSHLIRPGMPTLLLGDVNAVPSMQTHRRPFMSADRTHDILTSGPLIDARVLLAAQLGERDLSSWATYPAQQPEWPLDGALATAELMPVAAEVIGETESDHRGLAVRYRWLSEAGAAEQGRWHAAVRRHQFEAILARDFAVQDAGQPRRLAALLAVTGFPEVSTVAAERYGLPH